MENVDRDALMTITEADVRAARAADTQLAKAERQQEALHAQTRAAISALEALNAEDQ